MVCVVIENRGHRGDSEDDLMTSTSSSHAHTSAMEEEEEEQIVESSMLMSMEDTNKRFTNEIKTSRVWYLLADVSFLDIDDILVLQIRFEFL